jgi:ribose/xylose/arabinose/galactoside ABC-type transport system permease subunit
VTGPAFRSPASRQRHVRAALPSTILAMMVVILISLPLWSGTSMSTFAVFNTFQNAATLGLLALAVGLTMLAGEFDLSSIAVFTLGGLLAILCGETTPVLGIAAAVGAGALIGALQGGILAVTGISSVPLTLGSYIALSGLCHIVAGEGILSSRNYDIGLWLDDTVAVLFSPRSLIVLSVFLVLWAVMRFTRIGIVLRAVGADRRAARSSGIATGQVLTGVFILSGMLCGLGGALFAFSTTAAKYDLGVDPFVFAITAILLGGVDVAGGRGSVMGILTGVLTMSLIDTLFLQLAMPTYVMDLARAALLLLVVLIEAPDLSRRIKAWSSNRRSAKMIPSAE